jgi:hypothetical protein
MSEQTLTEFVAKRDAKLASVGIYGESSPYSADQNKPFHVFEGQLVRERDGKFIRPNYARPSRNDGRPVRQSSFVRFMTICPYSWPGGGEHFAIMSDGGTICAKCVGENAREIVESSRRYQRGNVWHIEGIWSTQNSEPNESIYCDHCSRDLQNVEQTGVQE